PRRQPAGKGRFVARQQRGSPAGSRLPGCPDELASSHSVQPGRGEGDEGPLEGRAGGGRRVAIPEPAGQQPPGTRDARAGESTAREARRRHETAPRLVTRAAERRWRVESVEEDEE